MKRKKISLISLVSLGIAFISLFIIIAAVRILNIAARDYLKRLKVSQSFLSSSEILTPSGVLLKKSFYSGKKIRIRGRVFQTSIVCERKGCPSDDSCCGCPPQRDLSIVDGESVLTSKTSERLTLLNSEGKSLCQRIKGSCRYECGDWRHGAVYDVDGVFWAEQPPPGWSKSLEYYFKVEGKNLVKITTTGDKIGNLVEEIKNLIKKSKTSGFYVLP